MAKGVNGLLGDEDGTAGAAMGAFGQTGFGASRRLGGVDDLSMTGRINLSYLLGTTMTAGLGLFALLGAGGLSGDDPLAPSMAKVVDLFLGDKNLVADRAVLALGQAGPGAVGGDGSIDDFGMTSGEDGLGLGFVAAFALAGEGHDAILGAGGFLADGPLAPIMAESGNDLKTCFVVTS